jgi:hypothetical protein
MKSVNPSLKQKKGFGASQETIEKHMKDLLKRNQQFDFAGILLKQQEWLSTYRSKKYEYSLQDLLQCEHRDLRVNTSQSPMAFGIQHYYLKHIVSASYGFWNITVNKDIDSRVPDFTIGVNVGGASRFHPVAIRECISRKYGVMTYYQWKAMVLDDLQSLKRLVEVVRERINIIAPSIVCCPSAKRLCKRVGIPVERDVAFLFPSNFS